ncbi:hypothetical protein V2J09_016588, partial [Rumex salicifolius]
EKLDELLINEKIHITFPEEEAGLAYVIVRITPIGFQSLERGIKEMWHPSGRFAIVDLPNGFYDSIQSICSWVWLVNLPIILYEERLVRPIASCLGRPIRVDKNTLHATRGKFASVCIELDLKKPLRGAILVNEEIVIIEYEGLGDICADCRKQGHLVQRYPLIPHPTHGDENERAETRNDPEKNSKMIGEDVRSKIPMSHARGNDQNFQTPGIRQVSHQNRDAQSVKSDLNRFAVLQAEC